MSQLSDVWEWSLDEHATLCRLLEQAPPQLTSVERCLRIAAHLHRKTARDVALRLRWMATTMKQQQQQQQAGSAEDEAAEPDIENTKQHVQRVLHAPAAAPQGLAGSTPLRPFSPAILDEDDAPARVDTLAAPAAVFPLAASLPPLPHPINAPWGGGAARMSAPAGGPSMRPRSVSSLGSIAAAGSFNRRLHSTASGAVRGRPERHSMGAADVAFGHGIGAGVTVAGVGSQAQQGLTADSATGSGSLAAWVGNSVSEFASGRGSVSDDAGGGGGAGVEAGSVSEADGVHGALGEEHHDAVFD
mmetsp:Transcript_16588/g.45520  ORF Transcript_16588/g.45520 Transcript_16588/m.45520 type:complete len:302 (+) Transcript_16588:226-1131(+)